MTDAFVAFEGAGAPGAAQGKVFRTELNPVDFLVRAAYVYPEKTAIVDEHGGVEGLRALYVALTRATKTLVVVHARDLPQQLANKSATATSGV